MNKLTTNNKELIQITNNKRNKPLNNIKVEPFGEYWKYTGSEEDITELIRRVNELREEDKNILDDK